MRLMVRSVLAALGLLSLGLSACGKDLNVDAPAVLEFPNSMPEEPRPLTASGLPTWTSGHGIAATDQYLFVVDRDNGTLVRMKRATLVVDKTLQLGARPEQVVVGPDGSAFVTVRGQNEVVRIAPDFTVAKRSQLTSETYGIALSIDARTAYVTMPLAGEVLALDAASLETLDSFQTVDPLPRGIAVSPNGWLAVAHQTSNIAKIPLDEDGLLDGANALPALLRQANPADHMTGARVHALISTRALAVAVSPETSGVFVAHVSAAPGNAGDFLAAASTMVDGPDGAPVPMPPGAVPDAAMVPPGTSGTPTDGGYGTTGAVGASFNIPTRPVEVAVTATDGTGTPLPEDMDFPVQDKVSGEPMTHLVDQPSDIVHHPSWSLLFMTGYGSDNVIAFSTAAGDPLRSPVAIIGVGHAPRAIAIAPDGQKAYVVNEHELTVSEIDLTPLFALPLASQATEFPTTGNGVDQPNATQAMPVDSAGMAMTDPSMAGGEHVVVSPNPASPRVHPTRLSATRSVAYGKDPLPAQVRRGARVFTFARNTRISHAGEFACASCHFEGTEDKLTWFIPDGPRQTPSLAGRLEGTAPFNWAGSKAQLQSNMVQTVERMGGDGLTKGELADLEQYLLHGLVVPQNPNVAADGTLTAQQAEGKALFNDAEVGCSTCHRPGQSFTDGDEHDVGTGSDIETFIFDQKLATDPAAHPPWRLNTPTLKGLFYTAPYLHDGSAPTLEDVFARTGDTMGHTSQLSAEQKAALIAYLKTL